MESFDKILCFGDSVTYGEGIKNGGWVELLRREALNLSSRKKKTSIYNLGVQSENSDGLARRFEAELIARTFKKESKLILLSYGLNDVIIHKNKNRVPKEFFVKNLGHCINIALNNNCLVNLLSISPIAPEYDGKVNLDGHIRLQKDIDEYNDLIRDLTQEFNLGLIDIAKTYANKPSVSAYLCDDGLHPNDAGHEIILQTVTQQIIKKSPAEAG